MNIIEIKSDPFFLLGVLNSKAISYWFVHKFGKLQRGIFPQFKINELKIFPVPDVDKDLESSISITSKKLTELMKAEQKNGTVHAQLEELNLTLDNLVYQAFGLDASQVLEIERDLNRGA